MSRLQTLANALAPLLVICGIVLLVTSAVRSPIADKYPRSLTALDPTNDSILRKVDQLFAEQWREASLEPASRADDLTILRRLSLVLHGTVPSLEEIRLFESDRVSDRLERWTESLLADRRYSDYFARRLSRVFVGADQGQFVVFRRDRFWAWLGEQLHADRAYDAVVRDMISGRGLWTDKPQVNFVAAAVTDNVIDQNKLAGRTARAFLGQRIDCAQCHNHPFAEWKQNQFSGLAACFNRVSISLIGIEDNKKVVEEPSDRMTQGHVAMVPAVPFHPEWLPEQGTMRERLAAWVTHPENRRFDRAIVNRVWGLMFGKPWIEPVDDLPNPRESGFDASDLLDALSADFQASGRSLKCLIRTIAATRMFRLSSQHSMSRQDDGAEKIERAWAAFPVTRLRPEQVIGSMLQASSIKTLDQDSHWTIRAVRFFKELDFVKEYGDLGDDEMTERTGTIPQALLRMNSDFSSEWTKGTIFSAAGRISGMATDDDACVDLCFLVCLTRHPTDEERVLLKKQLEGHQGDARTNVVEDLYWSLFNSPEFSWEH